MAKGRKNRVNQDNPQLEMTPMIDCVFQLLIFFIVTLRENDILANLEALRPAPSTSTEIPKTEPITILIGPLGFYFDGAPLTQAQLEVNLRRVARTNPNATIIVKCTNDSPHGFLVRALDSCYKYGLRQLSVFSM